MNREEIKTATACCRSSSPSFLLVPVGVEVCSRVDFDVLHATVYLLSSWQNPFSMLSNNQCRDTQYTFHFLAHSYFWPVKKFNKFKFQWHQCRVLCLLSMRWNSQCLTCWFANDEVSTLVHFELTGIVRSVLLTEPLHFFTFCAGETCHAHSATTQHRAQIFLNR